MLEPCVYILAGKRDGILCTGVTSDLPGRMEERVQGLYPGFTKRYAVKMLVCYELHETMEEAIERERRIKEWKRAWKVRLIESFDPEWRDLFDRESSEIADGPADRAREREQALPSS